MHFCNSDLLLRKEQPQYHNQHMCVFDTLALFVRVEKTFDGKANIIWNKIHFMYQTNTREVKYKVISNDA